MFVAFKAFLTTIRHGGLRKGDVIPPDAADFNTPGLEALLDLIPSLFRVITSMPVQPGQPHFGGGLPTRASLTWLVGGLIKK